MSARPLVEVLAFDGCPNVQAAVELVQRTAASLGVDAELRIVRVETAEEARRLRFLGSPSVRVDGADVEPGADARGVYALACRVYETERGERQGTPVEGWVRSALAAT